MYVIHWNPGCQLVQCTSLWGVIWCVCMAGELGPSEREAAARDRAEMQVLQGELASMLGKVQQAKTALSSAQHQVLPPAALNNSSCATTHSAIQPSQSHDAETLAVDLFFFYTRQIDKPTYRIFGLD